MFDFGFSLEEIQQLGLLILLGITGINTIMLIDIYLHQLPPRPNKEKKQEPAKNEPVVTIESDTSKYDNENNPIF